jgi:hypothetical protein
MKKDTVSHSKTSIKRAISGGMSDRDLPIGVQTRAQDDHQTGEVKKQWSRSIGWPGRTMDVASRCPTGHAFPHLELQLIGSAMRVGSVETIADGKVACLTDRQGSGFRAIPERGARATLRHPPPIINADTHAEPVFRRNVHSRHGHSVHVHPHREGAQGSSAENALSERHTRSQTRNLTGADTLPGPVQSELLSAGVLVREGRFQGR